MAPTSRSLRADSETGLLGRLRALLPQGNTLPREVWLRRHRWLVLVLAAQGVGITIYALFRGFTVPHSCAEGVETKAQLDVITALGCGYAQGFYLSRPLEPERVPELLSGPLPRRAPVSGPDAVRS